MTPKPIPDEPALMIGNLLVIADIHIGIEDQFEEKGVLVPKQINPLLERIERLLESSKAKGIVILGDLKHNIPAISRFERRDIPRFLHALEEMFDQVHIVPGNHDGNLRRLVPSSITLHPIRGFKHDKVGFIHGHSWPSEEVAQTDLLVMGHNHPVVVFTDSRGFRYEKKCWLRATFRDPPPMLEQLPKELIKIPAFSDIVGGAPVNSKRRPLGPMMREEHVDLASARIHLLDGTYLGQLKDLEPVRSKRGRADVGPLDNGVTDK